MSTQRLLLLTGSGKCGTSLVANIFHSCGFYMGHHKDSLIIEGDKWNVTGYWEHRDVLRINERILSENGLEWGQVPSRLPLELSSSLRSEMLDLLESSPYEFCCKDPRFVWTADLWSSLVRETVMIAIFRNPAGFVRSISKVWPDRFDAQRGLSQEHSVELAVWEKSNRRLLDLSHRYACHWVCFDDPAEILRETLQVIVNQLGRSFNSNHFDGLFLPSARHFSSHSDIRHEFRDSRYKKLYSTLRDSMSECDGFRQPTAKRASEGDRRDLSIDLAVVNPSFMETAGSALLEG
jgi:hypothetical protein